MVRHSYGDHIFLILKYNDIEGVLKFIEYPSYVEKCYYVLHIQTTIPWDNNGCGKIKQFMGKIKVCYTPNTTTKCRELS